MKFENTDEHARRLLADALDAVGDYYQGRGIFQDRFGFGVRPAVVVVDFAYGWTDAAYAAGSERLDPPVENTRVLLAEARQSKVPIIYTTSAYRPASLERPLKSAADVAGPFREWDERACQIDERLAPRPEDLVIQKESASAFAGTHLAGYLIGQRVDTLLITGCSTSACVRATATDAKSYRFRPIIVESCVGDRSAICHVFTLYDIQARFADVVSLDDTLAYLRQLPDAG